MLLSNAELRTKIDVHQGKSINLGSAGMTVRSDISTNITHRSWPIAKSNISRLPGTGRSRLSRRSVVCPGGDGQAHTQHPQQGLDRGPFRVCIALEGFVAVIGLTPVYKV